MKCNNPCYTRTENNIIFEYYALKKYVDAVMELPRERKPTEMRPQRRPTKRRPDVVREGLMKIGVEGYSLKQEEAKNFFVLLL